MLVRRQADHRREEVGEPVVDDEEPAGRDRADRQQDHRHGHEQRRLVRVRDVPLGLGEGRVCPGPADHAVLLPALRPEIGHEHDPGHVERSDAGADDGAGREDPARGTALFPGGVDDAVLGEEPGERRYADDRQVPKAERNEGDRQELTQPAVAPHVHLVVHAVQDRPGAEEQPRLEEPVREQVRDGEHVSGRAEAGRQRHVADLRHRRPGECLLNVVLGAPDDRAEQQGDRPDDRDRELRGGGVIKDGVGTHDQIHASRDHCRRMNKGRHRRRALHRVEQPGLQRHLGGLTARTEQQQQSDRRGDARAARLSRVEHPGEVERAELGEHQHDRQGQPGVADTVDDERLLGRDRRALLELPEPDQQVGRQADALPPDVKAEVVVRQHQQQHRRDEQVQVAEEAAPVGVMGHVGDRVDEDQRANPGDQQHETDRQRVNEQADVRLEAVDRNPGVHVQVLAACGATLAKQREERDQSVDKRRQRHQDAEYMPPLVGAPTAKQQDCRAEDREREQQPRVSEHAGSGERRHRDKSPQYLSRFASSTDADLRAR